YEGQEICIGFSYAGNDAHNWAIDDVLISSDDGVHIDEDFTGTQFPPEGWSRFDFDGTGQQWDRTTVTSNSPPASGRHSFSTAGLQDGWLVTPKFTLGANSSFTYADHTQFLDWYVHSGVWVSTGDCDPTPTEGPQIAPVHYPVAVFVQHAANAAQITVDPAELTSTQAPNQQVTKQLTIGNVGDADLQWSVFENHESVLQPTDASSVAAVRPPEQVGGDGASLSSARRLLGGVFGSATPQVATPEVPTPA